MSDKIRSKLEFSIDKYLVLCRWRKAFFCNKIIHSFFQGLIVKRCIVCRRSVVIVKIPEATGLFCKAITGKPGEFKIPAIVKTADAPCNRIGNFFLSNEFFYNRTIQEKVAVSVGRSDAVISC